jgi:cytochrome subunit of sulfide dehydrogenase
MPTLVPVPRPVVMAAVLSGALASPAMATDDVAALRTAALAATCANCHGTAGRAVDRSTVPGLAGVQREYFIAQMKDFRGDNTRKATVMHQLAKGYTDAQIEQLATYFAAQPR